MGLFFSGLAWLKLLPPPEQTPQARAVVPGERQQAKPGQNEQERPSVPRPRFDFYTILPEMEVVVPEPEPEPEPVRIEAKPRTKPTPPERPKPPSRDFTNVLKDLAAVEQEPPPSAPAQPQPEVQPNQARVDLATIALLDALRLV